MSSTLEVQGVQKRFGEVFAVREVSFSVDQGECVALVGESGSGKTTLLRMFNRMVVPDAGEVHVRGQSVAEADPICLRRSIGYVQQDGGLLPHWRVLRNIALVPWLEEDPQWEDRALRALAGVGLEPERFAKRWPAELSGGQRQRVAIARALAHEPDVILLDEPFGALDAITRGELQQTFDILRRRVGLTAVLVTHDLREAVKLATRVIVLRKGRVEQNAPVEELLGSPATDYVRELLSRAGVIG